MMDEGVLAPPEQGVIVGDGTTMCSGSVSSEVTVTAEVFGGDRA